MRLVELLIGYERQDSQTLLDDLKKRSRVMKIIKAVPKLVALFFVVVVIVDLGQLLLSIISPWQPDYIFEYLFRIASKIVN